MALSSPGRFVGRVPFQDMTGEAAVGLTTGQWLSLIPALAGVVGLLISLKKRVPAHWNVSRAAPEDADDFDDQGGGPDRDVDPKLRSEA